MISGRCALKSVTLLFLFFLLTVFFTVAGFTQETQEEKSTDQEYSLVRLLNTKINTAAKYEQSISEAPASITIITSEDIERYGYRTLEELFMHVRGFYTSYDRNYSYLGIRGFGRPTDYNNRILLLINGHALNDGVYGGAYIGTDLGLDLDSIERIEIVRGPASALYGTNAMFATLNIITKKGNTIDGLRLSAETGSYGRLKGSAAFGKEFDNGMDIFISGHLADIEGNDISFEEYDDPSTNNGIAEDLDWDKYHGFLTTINYKDFTLHGIIASREKGIPTGAWAIDFNNDSARTKDANKFIELRYNHKFNTRTDIILSGYYHDYRYRGVYPYDNLDWTDSTDNRRLGGELRFHWDFVSNNRLIVGAEYRNHLRADYHYRCQDYNSFSGDFPYNILSFYFQDEYQLLKNLSLTLGLRHDEYSTVGSSTTPRAAIVFNPMKSGTLKLLCGKAFRAPNIYEVNYEEEGYWKANHDLKPEKIRTIEVVWEQQLSDELFGVVSFYSFSMNDLIDTAFDLSDSLYLYKNINKVKARGVELELNAHLKMGLKGYASYSHQNAKDNDTKEKLTNSPSHILKAGLSFPVFNYFYLGAQWLYESSRITVYESETTPYLIANMHLSSKKLFNHMRVMFLVRNLFNTNYELPGGFEHIQPAIIQDGRNFSVKIEFKF